MAETFGLTSCPSGLVSESELSHNPKAQYGFILKLSRHRGKNTALRAEKPQTSAWDTKKCFSCFFFSVVGSRRLFSVRAAAKASELGFDKARRENKWV